MRKPVEAGGHWFWGVGEEMADRPLELLDRTGRLGDIVHMRFGPFNVYQFNNPEHIRHILHTPKIYGKQTATYRRLRALLGLGLVVSDGDLWLRQRRIAQPAFHKERVNAFAESMVNAAKSVAEKWREPAARNESINLIDEMTRTTLEIVTQTLLGGDTGADVERVATAFPIMNEILTDRLNKLVPMPLWIPTKTNRRFNAALASLDRTVYDIIARRRASGREHPDLLSMLMHARDEETGATMDDRQLRDELTTILLAGHETTAVALTWAFYLLSQNPDAEAKLHDELGAVLGGRAPSVADLPRLPWTRQVIDETMRLYPPVWALDRSINSDDDLDGYRIKKGAYAMIAPWVVHRLPSLWAEPEKFRPERFGPGAPEIARYSYFPFIGGPRQCIGNNFALIEAQLVLATIAQKWRLKLAPDQKIELQPLVTLRPKHGMRMTLSPVEDSRARAAAV